MLLSQILNQAALNFPEREAVVCGKHRFTYADFRARVIKLAHAMQECGIGCQDRVAIIHKNCHYFLECYFACAYLGAICVPINFRLSRHEFAYILSDSGARLLITQPEFADQLTSILNLGPQILDIIWTAAVPECPTKAHHFYYEDLLQQNRLEELSGSDITETSIAQIYYTSGTTGQPKGVVLTHKNNYVHAVGTIRELNLTAQDHWLHVSPMFHLADAWSVWAITNVGGVHILVPEFEPNKVLRTVEREKVTLSNLIPTMLNILVKSPEITAHDLSSFRLVMSGGASIAPDVIQKVINLFKCDYIQTYGMTETSPFLTMSILKPHLKKLPPEEQFKYKITTGRAFADVELKVVNQLGSPIEANEKEVGEIVVKGATIFSQYWRLPTETEKCLVDGWLHTGDLATINPEGYVNIVDRKNDMIITGGENVYSIEVENALYMHPDILEAAVIGVPDDILGEKIRAVVALKSGKYTAAQEIIDFCKQHLARFKCPKEVQFVTALPKTGSGKISKRLLRDDSN
ncbi:long-chain-fatty-acid--CoA ligase [candidate division CSSED10-310 bacterium]|uniref:Long-chain-fatty-acid--CoA ligase n=1 Tax=candidate division CSSED10-310 bacterium TaxID=2855610 RepID=A0ABV6Z2S4_UNCC1